MIQSFGANALSFCSSALRPAERTTADLFLLYHSSPILHVSRHVHLSCKEDRIRSFLMNDLVCSAVVMSAENLYCALITST